MSLANFFRGAVRSANGDRPKRERSQSSELLSTTSGTIIFGAVIVVVFSASEYKCSGDFARAERTFATAAAIGLAAMLLGGLFGFLFGIPKAGAQDHSKPYSDNSNLVEISDWLTKILVGAGLVTLTKIPPKLEALADWLGTKGFESADHGSVFALALIVFYTVCGFLWSYVWTRLYFAADLRDAASNERLLQAVHENLEEVKQNPVSILLVRALALPPPTVRSDETAQAVRKQARFMGSELLAERPTSRKIAIHYSRLLEEQFGERAAAIQVLEDALLARRNAGIEPNEDDAALMYNIACYLNLNARELALSPNAAESAKKDGLRKKAVDLLREAGTYDKKLPQEIKEDPDLKDLAAELT